MSKHTVWWAVFQLLWWTLFYFGFLQDVQGAENVLLFWTWLNAFGAINLLLASTLKEERTKTQAPLWRQTSNKVLYLFMIVALVWVGAFWTAGAVLWLATCRTWFYKQLSQPEKENNNETATRT